jgi:5-methyltetrahydrofolate--homocysteine methyltransferase
VSGETHSLERILPLVKEYGAAVIGLAQDDDGIPKTAEKRVAVAHKICEAADKMGIPREDIVVDVMTYAIGAEAKAGKDVLTALNQIREELGLNMTMGASNISFGMPDRPTLNSAWMAMVIAAGGTALIADAARVMPAVLSADLVLGRDRFARRYLEGHRKRQQAEG